MSDGERAVIIGVTGFIGSGLPPLLAAAGIRVTGVSRSGGKPMPHVDGWQKPDALDLNGHGIVINLAGEPIDKRWTARARRGFHESRVGVTRLLVEAIRRLPAERRPRVLVNGSAVGIYGDRGDEVLTESAAPGEGYLAGLCAEWEEAAREAEALGVRVVLLRTGVVLGKGGAAFEKLKSVFKTGIGGRLGPGLQWMPWVHADDLRRAVVHAILPSSGLSGPVNGTAPAPERNADFTAKFAAALHRPAVLPVPGIALKLALGGFGGALLSSQRAVPAALEADGFVFRYPTLDSALKDLV
jgi:uncharacterized protein